jgi:thioredoxin reductase
MNIDLAVIGGGAAGLTAAVEAAKQGVKVVVIDENLKAGGQLFKQIHKFFGSEEHWAGIRGIDIGNILLTQIEELKIQLKLNTTVWGLFEDHKIGISNEKSGSQLIEAERIIAATGAYENTALFPGWTLPGVIGAGAAQTMMNVNRVKPGHKVLMVGSGNVGLIVAYQMLLAGVDVVGIVEYLPKIGGYFVHAAKVIREGVPIYLSSTIVEAIGKESVEQAVVANVDKEGEPIDKTAMRLEVDAICLSVGLRPRNRLLDMVGCKKMYLPELGGFVPIHDENMETSIEGFYIAGDLTGVEEASTAIEEGRLAGIAVAESLDCCRAEDMKETKDAIRDRLNDLRLGPFGDFRQEAKKKLIGGSR